MYKILFISKAYKQFFLGLFVCLFFAYTLQGQEVPLTTRANQFHHKPVHSFKFYLNNAIYTKEKFTNQNPNPK